MTVAERLGTQVAGAPVGGSPGGAPGPAGGGATAGAPPTDARQVAERIERLLGEIGAVADPRLTERAEDLVGALMQFYGAGVRRILELADEANLLEGKLLDRLVRDDLVASVLILHDLHPLDLEDRIALALDRVRPYLGSHGGDVEIVAIEGDVVRLRMDGSCSSCPSSTVTLNFALEKAILEAAPEIARVEAAQPDLPAGPLIQLDPRPGEATNGHAGHRHAGNGHAAAPSGPPVWMGIEPGVAPAPGGLRAVDLGGTDVLLSRAGTALYAYRNRCANCRSPLHEGTLDNTVLACRTCGYRFDVRLAGRSVGDGALHLEPFPLLEEASGTRVAVPAAAG